MIEAAGGLKGWLHNSADYIHLVTEIMKAACADREYRYGDPLFVDVGMDELLSDAHVSARVGAIDRERAMPDMPPPIGRYPGNMPPPAAASRAKSDAVVEPDTSYCCAVDRWGNAMSATPSDGSWRSPVIPGLGIVPSGRGTQSRPDPSHPSGVAPGKRPEAHAQPGHRRARRRQRHPVRRAGRRRAGAGHAAGVLEHLPFRHGYPGGDRAAALCHLQLPQLLRALHPPARPANRDRAAPPRHRRRDVAGAGSAAPARSRPSCSTAAPASCAPAPISASPPMPLVS